MDEVRIGRAAPAGSPNRRPARPRRARRRRAAGSRPCRRRAPGPPCQDVERGAVLVAHERALRPAPAATRAPPRRPRPPPHARGRARGPPAGGSPRTRGARPAPRRRARPASRARRRSCVATLTNERASTTRSNRRRRRPSVVELRKKARSTAAAASGGASAETCSAGRPFFIRIGGGPDVDRAGFGERVEQRRDELAAHVVDVRLQQQHLGRGGVVGRAERLADDRRAARWRDRRAACARAVARRRGA